MLVRSIEEADGSLAALLADVERGETVLLTRDDRPVAEVRPVAATAAVPTVEDRTKDPAWLAAYEEMCAMLKAKPDYGIRLGKITEEDKYGPSRW